MKRILALLGVLVISGCVAQSQLYMNSDRRTVRCAASGAGITGMVASGINMSNCDADFRNLGYVPIDQAGVTGIWLTKPDGSLIITKVAANSPAEKAGIAEGDRVVSVNGKKPENAAEAIRLMFGVVDTDVTLVIQSKPAQRTVTLKLVPYLSLYGAQQTQPK